MSFYVAIAGVIIGAVGVVSIATAALILRVKSNQQENLSDKRSLLVASIFLGVSIVFLLLTFISLFVTLAAKGCKRSKVPLIIFFILSLISLIIAIVITRIFVSKKAKAGDTNSVRDLQSAWILPLVGLGLMAVSFVLLYIVIGRKFKKVTKICRKVNDTKAKVPISQ